MLSDPASRGVREEFVWIDIACYNQHTIAEETIAFDMEAIVKSIGKVAFAVASTPLFNNPAPAAAGFATYE